MRLYYAALPCTECTGQAKDPFLRSVRQNGVNGGARKARRRGIEHHPSPPHCRTYLTWSLIAVRDGVSLLATASTLAALPVSLAFCPSADFLAPSMTICLVRNSR